MMPQTEVFLICGLVIILILVVGVVWYIPKRQINNLKTRRDKKISEFEREKECIKLEDDTRKTLAQIIGGVFLIAGLFFTYNTYRLGVEQQKINAEKQNLDRRGQITDRFNKAVTNLGNSDLSVRLGGLYALEQILKDSPEEHQTIVEILSAYIREKAKLNLALKEDYSKDSDTTSSFGTDVQAAMTILGRRPKSEIRKEGRIALDYVRVGGINLYEADLSGASLFVAKLTLGDLRGAKFNNADLRNAEISRAYLNNADLRNANLSSATFKYAILNGANLRGADLEFTNFFGADLNDADLSDVENLTANQLEKAAFEGIIIDNERKSRESALKYFREKEPKK